MVPPLDFPNTVCKFTHDEALANFAQQPGQAFGIGELYVASSGSGRDGTHTVGKGFRIGDRRQLDVDRVMFFPWSAKASFEQQPRSLRIAFERLVAEALHYDRQLLRRDCFRYRLLQRPQAAQARVSWRLDAVAWQEPPSPVTVACGAMNGLAGHGVTHGSAEFNNSTAAAWFVAAAVAKSVKPRVTA